MINSLQNWEKFTNHRRHERQVFILEYLSIWKIVILKVALSSLLSLVGLNALVLTQMIA